MADKDPIPHDAMAAVDAMADEDPTSQPPARKQHPQLALPWVAPEVAAMAAVDATADKDPASQTPAPKELPQLALPQLALP